jgi:tetratricopeptide (TPR) repeat protein
MANPKEAAKEFYRAIELKPDFYAALNNLGAVLIELNRPIDAKQVIDKAIKIDPNSIQLLCNIASFYFLDSNLDKALVYAERAYNVDPMFVDSLTMLGKIYYQKSNYDKALDFYKKAYHISNNSNLTANIAQILERRSEYSEANKLITPLIESGNTDVATLLTYSALSRKYGN